MAELQDRFYAQDRDALLLIFQAMDSAGKDGAVKHVMSGLNPQRGAGVQLQTAFRGGARPRLSVAHPPPPARAGNIGIFNRSYYEEVLVAKVHNLPYTQSCPPAAWTAACGRDGTARSGISSLISPENGVTVVKFFSTFPKTSSGAASFPVSIRRRKTGSFPPRMSRNGGIGTPIWTRMSRRSIRPPPKRPPWYVIPADKNGLPACSSLKWSWKPLSVSIRSIRRSATRRSGRLKSAVNSFWKRKSPELDGGRLRLCAPF